MRGVSWVRRQLTKQRSDSDLGDTAISPCLGLQHRQLALSQSICRSGRMSVGGMEEMLEECMQTWCGGRLLKSLEAKL